MPHLYRYTQTKIPACKKIPKRVGGILSVLSGLAPLPRELVAEYVRAFAHCFSFDQFMEIFGVMPGDPINLYDVERFYQLFGRSKGFGYLDNREREWIRQFNQKVKETRNKP